MPTVRPEIFISAASRDLKTCRQLVRDALLTLGCVPVVQEHFPPGAGEVRAMLRERIAACHAVIHLAGECYGHEPREHPPGAPRRSYTQLEYDIARELGKPLYTFLCAADFPYDAHEAEPADLRALQDAHRAAFAAGDHLYMPVKDPRELSERVRELQTRVETLTRDLQKTRSWLGRVLAITAAAFVLTAGLLYGLKRQGEQNLARSDEHAARIEQRALQAEQHLAALQTQLQQQSKLISLVSEKLDRDSPAAVAAPRSRDPASAAREETARQLGIPVEDLRKQLETENSDVRALLAGIERGSDAAEAKADEWRKLKRTALAKLGASEEVAGHYAVALTFFQQALALVDKVRNPLPWCDTAQNYERALWQMGRHSEAETLARELVQLRSGLQGAEHAETLRSINALANVLADKGDFAAAEPLYRRCLEARERTLGREHPDTLRSVNNLAHALHASRDQAGAEALYRRCLEAQERTLGYEHPNTLTSVNNLAVLLAGRGDQAGAEALYRRCLEAQERTLGREHPDTLTSVNNLAVLLSDRGDQAGAEALYRRCLETRERTLGWEHPDTLSSVNNLAVLLFDKGDLTGAATLYRRCLEARERTLGKEHPDTKRTAENLALLEQRQRDPAQTRVPGASDDKFHAQAETRGRTFRETKPQAFPKPPGPDTRKDLKAKSTPTPKPPGASPQKESREVAVPFMR